jgi:hypothetical protein
MVFLRLAVFAACLTFFLAAALCFDVVIIGNGHGWPDPPADPYICPVA